MNSTESDHREMRFPHSILRRSLTRRGTLIALFLALVATDALGQGTSFTYQGKLTDGGNVANGQYDFQFKLYDTGTVGTGTQQGSTVTVSNVTVTAGTFTVQLDFGTSAFPGADRFLEIQVAPSGNPSFSTVSPRQQLRSGPYAIRSANATAADTATNALQLNGIAAGQYVVTTDSRLSDARPPTAGSTNYIYEQSSIDAIRKLLNQRQRHGVW